MVNVTLDAVGVPFPAFTGVVALAAVLVIVLDRRLGWLRPAFLGPRFGLQSTQAPSAMPRE